MLAPMIMAAAWCRFMIPTLTNPTISTVVTPELWIRAVVAAPIPTLTSRLSAVFSNRSLDIDEKNDRIYKNISCNLEK